MCTVSQEKRWKPVTETTDSKGKQNIKQDSFVMCASVRTNTTSEDNVLVS